MLKTLPDSGWRSYLRHGFGTNCVLYYPGLHDDVIDYSGNGNDGTITGATWTREKKGLWALSFDGDDVVTATNDTSLQVTDWTLIGWVKITDPTGVGTQLLLDKKAASFTGLTGYLVYVQSSNLYVNIGVGTTYRENAEAFTSMAWTHIAVGVNGNDFFWYYDAVSQGTTAFVGTPATGTDDLRIGVSTTGSMGILRLLNVALTADQIARSYQRERHLLGVR